MRNAEVVKKMNDIKARGRISKSYISNCYINFASESEDREWDALVSEHSLILINHEYKVDRIVFLTSDVNDMVGLAQKLPKGCVIEIISKGSTSVYDMIAQMGFHRLTELKKVSCKNIVELISKKSLYCSIEDKSISANMDNLDLIHEFLWETFDTRVSHLPTKEELIKQFETDELRIIKDNNKIISLLQAVIEPKSYYINQIINQGDKEDFHSMVIHSMKKYCANGGKYAYAWVESSNHASLKFFKKYGLEPDGMLIEVYVN